MRRNNCWLAVLAVSTVLPILRHGLARERFPLDQEDTELKANRSKAAYGLDQTTPSVGTEEIDFASRNDATKLVLDASPLDQPPKKCTIVDDATKTVPQGGCIWIEDADTSAQSYLVDQATSTIVKGQSQLDSRLISSISAEDSRKRSAGAQTVSEWTMGNSENSGERRLSTWISRGALEHTSERTGGVIHGDGGVRTATTSGRKRGTLAETTNRWGTRYGDRGASHYSHVGGSSGDDDSLTTPGDGERNFAGNRLLGGSDSTDGSARRGDGGSSTGSSSEIGDGEEWEASSLGADVDVLSERGYGDRRQYEDFPSGISGLDPESRESEGFEERRGEVREAESLRLEEKLRKRMDQSVYNLMDDGARLRELDYDKKRGGLSHSNGKVTTEEEHFWGDSWNNSVEGKGSFEEKMGKDVITGSVDRISDYRENQVKSETFDFLSTSMAPSGSPEGVNKLVESKLDHQEQLSKKSIDLSSSNDNYQRNQIKSETLDFLSTSMPPSGSLEGVNKLVESKLDHQEQLSKKPINLSSSNNNYQQNQIKSETVDSLSTSMPPGSLEGVNKLMNSKLDHQEQLSKKSTDLSSPNNNYQQNQIKSETVDSLSTSMPPKLADLPQHTLSKRSVDPNSDRLKTPLKPEISPLRFDPSPNRGLPLASSPRESNRERYNSAGIENPERVPTSRKSAEVHRDGSRDVSPEQRSTANNDVPEDNEPASANQVAFPVSRTAIEVGAVERDPGNLAFRTAGKGEATLMEESGKLENANRNTDVGESRSTDVVNNGTTDFHFGGDSDAKDVLKKENVGSREDRGLPRVEIQDGKEDSTRRKGSREDVSNSGADFNFPEINVAGNLSKRDSLTLNAKGDDNRDVVEEESRYPEDRGGDKGWIAKEDGTVTLMEQSREDVSFSGADFNFPEITVVGNLSKKDNLSIIEDKVTLVEESTKLTNANGNSSVNSLNSRHPSFRDTGTFGRKTNNPSIGAEDPPEGSETSPPIAMNSKENQRSSTKITNKNSSVDSLNSTHPAVPTTGTFGKKSNNPSTSAEDPPEDSKTPSPINPVAINSKENQRSSTKITNKNSSANSLNSTHLAVPATGTFDKKTQIPLKDSKTPRDSLAIKSRDSIEAHKLRISPASSSTAENDDEVKLPAPAARFVDQTPSATVQRSSSLAGTSNTVVENHEERETTSGVPLKLNGPLTNEPVIVFKDAASRTSRDSSNQNSRLSAHGIKDNEPAVGFPSVERARDVAGHGQGAETIDEVNLAEPGNVDLVGISKGFVDSMKQRDPRGNLGNPGTKLGNSMGKLGNSRLGASSVIATGNVEEERAEESSGSSFKTGLSGVSAVLGSQAKGTRDTIKGSVGSIEEFLSKEDETVGGLRVKSFELPEQEDETTGGDLAAVVKDSVEGSVERLSEDAIEEHEGIQENRTSKMRVENLQRAKQEDHRAQVGLAGTVEDSNHDPMHAESKSSRKVRVENLQRAKQEDQRAQVGLNKIVEDSTHDPMHTESESSIDESLGLEKDETPGNPRAKDRPPTKQNINTTVDLAAALNRTLNNPITRQTTSSTDEHLPSQEDNTPRTLKTEILQQKLKTQVPPASMKTKNIDAPPSQSSVSATNLRSPARGTSESPTKQRRDSSGFPTKSEAPSTVLGNKASNVTKIESFPFENRAPGASVLDRREFIAQGRATVTSTMDETTSPGTTSFDEDVPFRTTESGRMDAGASISSTTDMDRLVYLGIGEDRIATAANVSQNGGDNSSRELEYQWPVKHSAVVEGDLVLGGLMMVHEREDRMTCGPVMPQGGVQAVEAMLYTLDWLNERDIVPGVKIGAHILDDCDKDTYGLEMAVDFIKGSISNIDGAEYHCNKTAVRKVISGVVGAASSVTSIQVANLLRLFRIPQVSFFSTSPELSNKQRFEYFTRTIPSDHYQVKAMVDIVLRMGWSYVSIIYEESNYGIKAFEELEELLGKYDICIAIKEKLVKDSGVAGETAYDNIVLKLLTKPRAKGCIIYASDQEVAELMRAVRRCNATGAFSWIGSDGWSARGLVSNGNEPEVEGTLSVQPQANPIKGFKEYFLNLTVENNRRNPWFVEFWEDHFQCRYPNASLTPYNKRYTKPCTTKERLTAQNTAVEDQLQFVSDAVMAFAYAFRDIHKRLCREHPKNCGHMNPTNGTELLQYLREVEFEGLSGDKFKFDKNGDGPARYNIIHFKQTEPGKYKWVRVGKYLEGELRLNMSEIQFKLGHPQPPDSVCALPCEVGQAKKYVEGERCCWHCFNCTQYQIRHPKDETQCIQCRQGTVPDETHSTCRDIPQEFLRPESGWAIGAMSFSATGMLVTSFVCGVFLKHNDTPVVRASGRELSYVLLSGILLCYLVTFALVMKPTDIVCGIQRFAAGFCFTVVYAALLTKTNRISRIFNASKHSAKRPSFISPRSQLIICSGLVSVQILINGVWMIIDPAKAMHHYPTREDNLLVCNSYVDASYMIAFAYPIMLIVVCTVYAVLTRKIPEAFNESKHIGFTMYTTCVIWLAFVPLYFGTGNNVALRITSMSVTISLSASVTIACLFSPKLYIILIRPERNVRQSMMPARYNTTKSSAVTATNASSMIAPVTLTAATCDQNKTVKRHIINTIDCSTQSEYYELEVKDQKNGKPPATVVSRSTQTCTNNDKDSSAVVAGKDSKEASTTTTKENTATKQINNNARIGNGPVNQADVTL